MKRTSNNSIEIIYFTQVKPQLYQFLSLKTFFSQYFSLKLNSRAADISDSTKQQTIKFEFINPDLKIQKIKLNMNEKIKQRPSCICNF